MPYDLPATAVVILLVYLATKLVRSDQRAKWGTFFVLASMIAVLTKESVLVIPVAFLIVAVGKQNAQLAMWSGVAIGMAIILRLIYVDAIGNGSIWSYRSTVEILSDNLEALKGDNWDGAWYRHPALYFGVFIPLFTPFIRWSSLKSDQIRITRLAVGLFIVGTLGLGQIRESRILLEWAVPSAVLIAIAVQSRFFDSPAGAKPAIGDGDHHALPDEFERSN